MTGQCRLCNQFIIGGRGLSIEHNTELEFVHLAQAAFDHLMAYHLAMAAEMRPLMDMLAHYMASLILEGPGLELPRAAFREAALAVIGGLKPTPLPPPCDPSPVEQFQNPG